MQKTLKRKQISSKTNNKIPEKSLKTNKNNLKTQNPEPYPSHIRPTPEECMIIRDSLLEMHGFPAEFAQFRKERQMSNIEDVKCDVVLDKVSVLDGLVSTVLSQNTTDVNSNRAFANLKAAFPTWDHVLAADQTLLENAIRCGGLAPTKASCIKNLLRSLLERSGKLCLEYLRDLTIEEIKSELSSFKGIGPKTVACVLLFHLQHDDFPVDTHILQIAKTLHWVPEGADAKKTYLHLNQRIPKDLKFDLNCLLFTHGKMCNRCSTKVGKRDKKETASKPCPLLIHCKDL